MPAVGWSKGCERNVHNAYEARDPEGRVWRNEVGQRRDTPPADGPDQWLPPQVPGQDGTPDDPSQTARFDDHRSPASYGDHDTGSGWPAPDAGMPGPFGRDEDLAGTRNQDPRGPHERRLPDHTGHSVPPPAPASFDPQGAQRSLRSDGGDGPAAFNDRTPDRSLRERTGHLAPPPPPTSFDPHGAPGSGDNSGEQRRRLGGHDGTAPDGAPHPPADAPMDHHDGAGAERMDRRDEVGADAYVERPTPAGQQLRASVDRASSTVRRSVPLRTLLFVLPPLVLPALAFDLSLVATLVVALLLLWIAAAAGVFCTMMLEGSQHLALREIERRLADLPSSGGDDAEVGADAPLQEALMAIGAQLDRLDDRVVALSAAAGAPRTASDSAEKARALSHRPQEHVPNTLRDEQYDRYGQTAVPDTNWGESRWRR